MTELPTVSAALAAVAETLVNQTIKWDASSRNRLAALQGQWLQVEIEPFSHRFYLELGFPIRVASAAEGPFALSISGPPGAFLRYLQGNPEAGGLQIEGDIALAQQLSAIAGAMDLDWEAQLAEVLGEMPAHLLGDRIRGASRWLGHVGRSFFADAEEYIHHEARALPNKDETDHWAQQVEDARMALDRLEARVARLERSAPKTKDEPDRANNQEESE